MLFMCNETRNSIWRKSIKIPKKVNMCYTFGAHKERGIHRIYAIMQHMQLYAGKITFNQFHIFGWKTKKFKEHSDEWQTHTHTYGFVYEKIIQQEIWKDSVLFYLKLSFDTNIHFSIYQNNKHSLWVLGSLEFCPFILCFNGRCYFGFVFWWCCCCCCILIYLSIFIVGKNSLHAFNKLTQIEMYVIFWLNKSIREEKSRIEIYEKQEKKPTESSCTQYTADVFCSLVYKGSLWVCAHVFISTTTLAAFYLLLNFFWVFLSRFSLW